MKTTETQQLTNCCNAPYHFISPCLGEPGRYFCLKCQTEIDFKDTHSIEVPLYEQVSKGIYRKINTLVV
jgi:hypothetical protein